MMMACKSLETMLRMLLAVLHHANTKMCSSVCLQLSRCFVTSAIFNTAIKNVAVIGGGLMGSGIAQTAAQSSYKVSLVDVSNDALKNSINKIESSLVKIANKKFSGNKQEAEKYVSDVLARVTPLVDPEKAAADSDIVIEAILENLQLKQALFSRLDNVAPKHTIFATNTSSLQVQEIVSVTRRKDRCGGLHFFYPVQLMKLVEVVRTEETSDETFKALIDFGKDLGKTTVVSKDTPGFIVNSLLLPYVNNALQMLARGDASATDIDIAMKLGAGYPMGPFELLDFAGLDTFKFIMDGVHARDPNNNSFQLSKIIEDLVKAGKFGVKSGEGIYSYKK